MFIVDNPSPGLSFDPIRIWINPHKNQQHTIHLNNVRVPQTKVLGEVGRGFTLGQKWLVHHDRLLRGSMAIGILSRALEMAIEWAKQRVTYGRPIADRQAIQWMLTDVYIDIMTLRAASRETAARADAGDDVRVEASMIKYCAGEWGHRSIDKIMQVFGGTGETLDLPIAHWYHLLRHARIGGGTSEIHKFVMARALLDGRVNFQG
jgi:acyl-CoA dehydrogenase